MVKIGGWQRLWIVVSASAFIAIGVLSILLFPNASTVEHDPMFYATLSAEAKAQLAPDDDPDASEVTMPNGHVVRVRKGIDLRQSTPVLAEYESEIQQALRTKRVRFLIFAAVAWVVLGLGTYGIGWAIGWIYRGFKSDDSELPNKTLQPPNRAQR